MDYVDALLARCRDHAYVNAFSYLDADEIRAAAAATDAALKSNGPRGPLHGLPIAIKDNIDVGGEPTTAGTPALLRHRAAKDAAVVASLRRAGALPFGKTNMHELAYGLTSNNATFGPVRNPYALARIAGGSSGGTAAAVAARLVPAGLGTDTGGSIRQPAALCGLVGLRPSSGRYQMSGIVPISHTRDVAGLIARTVGDVALLDAVITGADPVLPKAELRALRVGVPRHYFFAPLDPEIERIIEAELLRLSTLGVELVEVDLPEADGCNARVGRAIFMAEACDDLKRYLDDSRCGVSIDELVRLVASPDVRQVIDRQFDATARVQLRAAYTEAMDRGRPALQQAYRRYFADNRLAAMVFPTTPIPASPIGADETVEFNGNRAPTTATYVRNTGPASIVGIPGLNLPVGQTRDGLPVGMELDGPFGSDRILLAIGAAWEATRDPFPPPVLP